MAIDATDAERLLRLTIALVHDGYPDAYVQQAVIARLPRLSTDTVEVLRADVAAQRANETLAALHKRQEEERAETVRQSFDGLALR